MNRISTIFLALAAGVLVFALYIDRNPNSGSAKQLFKRSTESRGTVPAGTQSSSIPGLRNSLDEVARNIGFESETVEVNFVNREFRTLGGQPIHLKQHKDRWIVLNFWATWCAPCREEMPSLEKLQENFRPEQLKVICVNQMEPVETVKNYVADQNLELPVILDSEGTLAEDFEVNGLPVTWVLTPEGFPLMRLRGSHAWDERRTVQLFQELLENEVEPRPS